MSEDQKLPELSEVGLKFSLKLKEMPVTLEGEDGSVRMCCLRELSGDLRDDYFTEMKDHMHQDSEGNFAGVKNPKGLNILLLSKCFYEKQADNSFKLVPTDVLNTFPITVLDALKDQAQKVSGLKTPVKNPVTGQFEMPSENEAKNVSGEAKPNSGSNLPPT